MAESPTGTVLASANPGKLRELAKLLEPLGQTLRDMAHFKLESPEETGLTFVENALIKARHASEKTGWSAIADDSGLVVDALHGAPGIYSARYAGVGACDDENLRKLLEDLKDVPQAQRGASFFTCVVHMRHAADPVPLICYGQWRGRILEAPRGAHGFGYDPIFAVPERDFRASAELAPQDKNAISHRGRALALLIEGLRTAR
jgi:XTP/dITP diphosphohydrolase